MAGEEATSEAGATGAAANGTGAADAAGEGTADGTPPDGEGPPEHPGGAAATATPVRGGPEGGRAALPTGPPSSSDDKSPASTSEGRPSPTRRSSAVAGAFKRSEA